MKKFNAIEGLRGWLAWTVVFSHLAMTSDIHAKGLGPAAVHAGHLAVYTFIIISGFVITHSVIERPEPYGPYLIRRFMRIFPVFAVTCVIGFFTSDIYAETLSHVPWPVDDGFSQTVATYTGIARSNHEFFWANAFAHLTMLHGAISNALLPFSEHAFNAPAWSLSLEWQFYLVAPFAIMLARRSHTLVLAAPAIAALEIAYQFGFLGNFGLPSFLPGVAGYFALGIASRIAYPLITGTIRYPGTILALLLVLTPLAWDAVPLMVWVLVFTGLTLDRANAGKTLFARVSRHALESSVATYFGSRSYSIYLCHLPIISVCHAFWLDLFPTALHVKTFFGVAAMALPLTLIISELLYRGIERPGIALGSILARRNEVAAAKVQVNG
jgi:peptidoglycan/LPS O-acetylase OafA/YrhL